MLCGLIFSIVLLSELPGGNLINLGLSGLFVASVAAGAIVGHRSLWFGREVGVLLFWVTFSTVPGIMAVDFETAMFKSLTMLQIVLLAFCVQQAIVWQKNVAVVLALYGVAVACAYAVTFADFSLSAATATDTDLQEGGPRVASTLANANAFGAACVMGLSLCFISIALNGPRWLGIVQFLMLPVLMLAAINSGSRTALLGALVVLLGSPWAFRAWRGVFIAKAVLAIPLLAVGAFALYTLTQVNADIGERIEQTFDTEGAIVTRVVGFVDVLVSGDVAAEGSDNSLGSRAKMIEEGVRILGDHPIIGVGLDNYRFVSEAGTYSHSNPIEVAVSTGLIGLFLYYSIYLLICWRAVLLNAKSRRHAMPRMVLVAMAGYALMDLTHISYYDKSSWLFLGLVTAALEVFSRELNAARASSPSRRRRRRRRRQSSSSREDSGENPSEFEDLDELGEVLAQTDTDAEGGTPPPAGGQAPA